MNYCWNWLIIYAYRNGLIDKEGFIKHWRDVQLLNAWEYNEQVL